MTGAGARDGSELISCMADPKDKSFIVHEVWDRKASQQAYLGWRKERGDLDKLATLLREPPVFVEMEHLAY